MKKMEKWKKEGKKKMNTVEDLHIFILNKKNKKRQNRTEKDKK